MPISEGLERMAQVVRVKPAALLYGQLVIIVTERSAFHLHTATSPP